MTLLYTHNVQPETAISMERIYCACNCMELQPMQQKVITFCLGDNFSIAMGIDTLRGCLLFYRYNERHKSSKF